MRWILIAALAVTAAPAGAETAMERASAKPLHFEGMDANGDGVVSRNEWYTWFSAATAARLPPVGAAPGEMEIRNADGQVVRVRPVPRALNGDDEAARAAHLRSELARAGGGVQDEGPIARRDRLRREASAPRLPVFEGFDTNGDNVVSREEMLRLSPNSVGPLPVAP